MTKVTILTHARILGFPPGIIVEVDDSPRLRSLLKKEKYLELIDPPDLLDREVNPDGGLSTEHSWGKPILIQSGRPDYDEIEAKRRESSRSSEN